MRRLSIMAIITTDKVVIIVAVTLIAIVLAYIFRFGKFSPPRKKGTDSSKGQESPSDSI